MVLMLPSRGDGSLKEDSPRLDGSLRTDEPLRVDGSSKVDSPRLDRYLRRDGSLKAHGPRLDGSLEREESLRVDGSRETPVREPNPLRLWDDVEPAAFPEKSVLPLCE